MDSNNEYGFLELHKSLGLLLDSMGCKTVSGAISMFRKMMLDIGLNNPISGDREKDLNILSKSVNPISIRLKNNPVEIDETQARRLYDMILE